MRRVIRICAVLMGVVLVGMTGGLGVLRATSEPPPMMIVLVQAEYNKEYYALFEPLSGKITRITSNYEVLTSMDISPDGRWLYFMETTEREETLGHILDGRLHRVSLSPYHPTEELLLDSINFSAAILSPNFTWLLYTDDTEKHLFAVNPLTGERHNLTSELPSGLRIPSYQLRARAISFDGIWVRFWTSNGVRDDIYYRVRIDGTGLEHIGEVDGIRILFDRPENASWYIGADSKGDNFYRINNDLQESYPIVLSERSHHMGQLEYWLTDEIALVRGYVSSDRYYTLFAVRVTDGQILWTANQVVENWYPLGGHRVFFRRLDFILHKTIVEAISPDGTDRRIVLGDAGDAMKDPASMEIFGWTPGSDWWFYTLFNFQSKHYEFHRLSADWKTDEVIWADEKRIVFQKWQGKHLIFSTDMGRYYFDLTGLYQLDSNTFKVKRIMQPSSPTWIVDVNGPNIEREFQPIPLLVVGGGLMSILSWGRVSSGINSIKGWARRPTRPKW